MEKLIIYAVVISIAFIITLALYISDSGDESYTVKYLRSDRDHYGEQKNYWSKRSSFAEKELMELGYKIDDYEAEDFVMTKIPKQK